MRLIARKSVVKEIIQEYIPLLKSNIVATIIGFDPFTTFAKAFDV